MEQVDGIRLQRFRQLKNEIRGSDEYLIVGIDIAKERHNAFFGTAAGRTLHKGLFFDNTIEGFRGIGQGWSEESSQCDGSLHSTYTKGIMRSTSNCDREAAAARAAAARAKAPAAPLAVPLPGGTPNYFGPEPNYANSPLPAGTITSFTITSPGSGYTAPVVTITDPACAATATATLGAGGAISLITLSTGGTGCIAPQVTIADPPPGIGTGAAAVATIGGPFTGGIRKFMDTLPGLGSANHNNLGNYIPVAVKDTTSYPGSDYYRIGVVNYSGQMHFDLPATTQLRGYEDLQATGTDANPPLSWTYNYSPKRHSYAHSAQKPDHTEQ